jgi:hypothetical protein
MQAVMWVSLMLGITAILYAITSAAYFSAARPGMTLAFLGYVIANIGFIWDAFNEY